MALGMARTAGTTRTRALVTTLVLYLAFIALFRVALPSVLAAWTAAAPATS